MKESLRTVDGVFSRYLCEREYELIPEHSLVKVKPEGADRRLDVAIKSLEDDYGYTLGIRSTKANPDSVIVVVEEYGDV